MLDGNNFVKAGWVHGLKLHEYSITEGSRFVIMGKVSFSPCRLLPSFRG